jgi:hypothetical protein
MSRGAQLGPRDREFFALVAQAAFANPFSEARRELDLRIIGARATPEAGELHGLAAQVVADRVAALEEAGLADLRLYPPDLRETVGSSFLFDVYHRFLVPFDRLAEEQIAAGDESVQVPFAEKVISMIVRRGIPREEALRYFAIFYQIRRAYLFIERGLTGWSPSMRTLRLHLWNNVFTHDIRWYERHLWNRMEDFSTMLLGETGTGKGTAASAIGRSGFIPFDEKRGRFASSFMSSFVSINLSQYPEALIESELFGHRKGAFTGAVETHEGIFARCSPHGAIFLDEIGDVATPVQIKLLQVLQDRTFSPVGSHEKLRFRGRVIAATNRPLEELRRPRAFRDDFFYRLCSDLIVVPTLRQRIAEDPREMDLLLSLIVERTVGVPSPSLVGIVKESLEKSVARDYPWPGNVRELEQAVRRILLTESYRGDEQGIAPDLASRLTTGLSSGTLTADGLLAGYCTLLYDRHGSYEEVARRTKLDRRTVKGYIEKHRGKQ